MYKFVKCKEIQFTLPYPILFLDLQPFEFDQGFFVTNREHGAFCRNVYDNTLSLLNVSSNTLHQWFFVSDFYPELIPSEIKEKLWNELGSLENPDIELIDTYNYILNG